MSNTVKILRGQTLLLHRDGTVLLRKKHVTDASVTTPWGYFVGTDEEVDKHIESLKLCAIVRPATPKEGVKTTKAPNAKPAIGTFRRLLNFIKRIF